VLAHVGNPWLTDAAEVVYKNVNVWADLSGLVVGDEASFAAEERQEMLHEVTGHLENVRIEFFKGLLVDFAKVQGADAIVKGLRAVSDFDYELQMAQMNQRLSGVDTLFMSTSPEYSFVSSSLVKEVATYGGDVAHLLPAPVHRRVMERIRERA
jgi:pantetheine-phosphate adenylyltransferase